MKLFEIVVINPIYTIIAVLILWQFFRFFFTKALKLTPSQWMFLDYFWLSIAFLGVISLVIENNRSRQISELSFVNTWISNEYQTLQRFVSSDFRCVKYNYTTSDIYKLDSLQARADTICIWIQEVQSIVNSSIINDYAVITDLPILKLKNNDLEYIFIEVNNHYNQIDSLQIYKSKLNTNINDESWKYFISGLGIILLIFAFAIRLSIVTQKISIEKLKSKKGIG